MLNDKTLKNLEGRKKILSDEEYQLAVMDAEQGEAANRQMLNDIVMARLQAGGVATMDNVPAEILPRMLELVIAQAMREYSSFYPWREYFPVKNFPPAAGLIVQPVFSGEGIAAWYYGGPDHPNVSVGTKEITIQLKPLTLSYDLNWLDMQQASYAGVNTETEKLNEVFRGLDRFVSKVIYYGDAAVGIEPFIGHANMPSGALPYGAWDATTADPDEMFADVMYAVRKIEIQNPAVEEMEGKQVDVWLGPTMYNLAADSVVNPYNGETVLQKIKRQPEIRNVRKISNLDATAGGAKDYIIVGVFDEDHVVACLGYDKTPMPSSPPSWYIRKPYVSSTAGIWLKRPLSFFRGTGLLDH